MLYQYFLQTTDFGHPIRQFLAPRNTPEPKLPPRLITANPWNIGASGEPEGNLMGASGWLPGAYRLAPIWPEGRLGVASGRLRPDLLHCAFNLLHPLGEGGLGGSQGR